MGISQSDQSRHSVIKRELRSQLLQQRQAIPQDNHEQASAQICAHLLAFCRSATTVFAFLPFKGEPDLRALFGQLAQLALPVIDAPKKTMKFYSWKFGETLAASSFGTQEPATQGKTPVVPKADTVILVPALALTSAGFRLGFGGGFYDRYLEEHRGCVTVGVVFQAFLRDDLPIDSWDMPVQHICTELGITSRRQR